MITVAVLEGSTNQDKLLLVIGASDALIADASVFTLLNINCSVNDTWDRIPGKGYYLVAQGLFTVINLYSRIYYLLISRSNPTLDDNKQQGLDEIRELRKKYKLKSNVIIKDSESITATDDVMFIKLMKDLKEIGGVNLGLEMNDYQYLWKQVRNMISHISFSIAEVGGYTFSTEDEFLHNSFDLPIYDLNAVQEELIAQYKSEEAFKKVDDKFVINTTVLLAYMPRIKSFLIKAINDTEDQKCKLVFDNIKQFVARQHKVS